jgi:uncharacterized repeat protein (TIGR02543 family)
MKILRNVSLFILCFTSLLFLYGCNGYHVFNFETNGGSTILGPFLMQGDIIDEPTPPTRSGCYFEGWYEDDNTFAIPYIFPGTMPNHNVTIYAKWSCCNIEANAPELADGLTPIYWDANNNPITRGNSQWDESQWYDYTDASIAMNTSRWANAMSEDGSYWVWIPRYVYRISTNWHNHTKGSIDICFVDGNDDSTVGNILTNLGPATDSDMSWTSHPAFTFGAYELNGIWVAKYEASRVQEEIMIMPGHEAEETTIDNAFNWSFQMTDSGNPYGFKSEQVNVHLMKQEEWGATAYLAHSKFGRNQVDITPNYNESYTGGADGLGWLLNGAQTTSGNLYGVYDMSGGKAEYVSAYIGDPDFSWREQCNMPNSPYCTIYDENSANAINQKGDAIYETCDFLDLNTAWFGHRSVFPAPDDVWFVRGGTVDPLSNPGIFAFDKQHISEEAAFRPVLIVYPEEDPLVRVTFISLGANVFEQNVAPGTSISNPGVPNNSNPGCIFGGWYYDSNFTSQATLPFNMPGYNVTLYARWTCCCNCDIVNEPDLFTGMNPLYFDDNNLEVRKYLDVNAQTINPSWVEAEWYDYVDTSEPNMENKSRWANAVSLDGSYWVWIPRFVYQISSGWHESTAGIIDVCFVYGVDDSNTGLSLVNTGLPSDSNGTWTSHPAFTFGSNELTGFWFAKFEASNDNGEILITHGVESWRSIPLDDAFNFSRQMETKTSLYGWLTSEVDSHQTKNEEWGAVAYLAHSKFGVNGQEVAQQNSGFYTGGGLLDSFITNTDQSTTGNPHGVYDMNGGGQEIVAAYVSLNGQLLQNACATAGSPYCSVYSDSWGEYTKGDAMWETGDSFTNSPSYNGWFGDYISPPLTNYPWIHRGGNYHSSSTSAGLFCYDGIWLYAYPQPDHYDRFTFRPVLIRK